MLRATSIVRKAAVREDRVADTAWLDHHAREGGHAALRSHGGLEFALDLDRTTALNDGDAVKLEDGRLVQVRAAPERLLEIRAETPLRPLRLAWQLGQRHAAAEIKGDVIYLEHDRALAELARGQGCSVTEVTRPFQPERADAHACNHDHGHGHDGHHHDHHNHDHHSHEHPHAHAGHEHEACGCGHDHKHDH